MVFEFSTSASWIVSAIFFCFSSLSFDLACGNSVLHVVSHEGQFSLCWTCFAGVALFILCLCGSECVCYVRNLLM